MKKSTFALALAAAAAMVSFIGNAQAKLIPGDNVPVTIKGNTTIVDVEKAGTAINWAYMDVEAGKTLAFVNNGSTVVNTVTSKKATNLNGTIASYAKGMDEMTDDKIGGNVTIINPYGFNISKTFLFRGDTFTVKNDKASLVVRAGTDRSFHFDSGNFKISQSGTVSGGMSIKTDTNDVIIIDAGDQNITVGDITNNAAALPSSISLSGKDVRTGDLTGSSMSGFEIKATGNITTGKITGTGNSPLAFNCPVRPLIDTERVDKWTKKGIMFGSHSRLLPNGKSYRNSWMGNGGHSWKPPKPTEFVENPHSRAGFGSSASSTF